VSASCASGTTGKDDDDREFEASVNCIAAAITPCDGHSAVAAIVVFGPANRLTAKIIEQVAPLVDQAATETSRGFQRDASNLSRCSIGATTVMSAARSKPRRRFRRRV
jgi:transcriptional regulator